MKKKLLFLAFFALLSLQVFSQAVAYPVSDIKQCGNEGFDLTVKTPGILGDQDPEHFTVTYFLTEADAEAATEPIENPVLYISAPLQIIYARVTSSIDESFAITTFTISWSSTVYIPYMQDVSICLGSYELPELDYGDYYTEPGGNGVLIPEGTLINETQTIYIYYSSDICTGESSFTVSIIPSFEIGTPTDLVVCDEDSEFVLVDLTQKTPEIIQNLENINISFHETDEDAEFNAAPIVNANTYITTSILPYTIWVRATNIETGCFKITSFSIVGGGCTDNTISGFASLDLDGNGCEVFEAAAAGIAISYTNDNIVHTTYTNADGYYSFENVPDGVNVVSAATVGPYTSTPNAYNFTMPANETDVNFCISATEIINDVAIGIVATTQARPGFSATYVLVYQNLGTTIQSGTVSFQFDSAKLTFVSASSPMVAVGNTLSLTYTNLYPLQINAIALEFTVMEPPIVNSQDVLTFTATIDPVTGDNNPEDNTAILNEIVVNSYDPNDIAVREGEYITKEEAEGYLNYVIRFQNTGDADAINIKIENTLDDNLDWSTFQPISASHTYKTNRIGKEVEFLFDNIHLADSLSNEPESHGHVIYRIKPKAGVKIGDVMAAQAHIYFDFNPAIDTNIVKTTIQNTAGVQENIVSEFKVYPNPASGKVNLHIQNSNATSFDLTITDILGKTILKSKLQNNDTNLDISSLTNGIYLITLEGGGARVSKKLIIK